MEILKTKNHKNMSNIFERGNIYFKKSKIVNIDM